jgi:ATP-dependent phosphofructokinase / diphosphate-dependent phosphofructokinase
MPTFGFQTARHIGVELVRNLMEDARSTRRWYVVVAMGRKAGHLALGIGKAAGATLTLVAEECPSPYGAVCHDLRHCRRRDHQATGDATHFGVAVLSEGLIGKLDPAELAELEDVERDEHGHVRFAEVDLARKVKAEVQGRLSERGLRVTITHKNVAMSSDARTLFPSMPNTAATSGSAPSDSCSAAAAGPDLLATKGQQLA